MSAPALPPSPAPQPSNASIARLAPLAGVVFALFLASGLGSCAWALLTGRLALWPAQVNRQALLDGDLTHHIAKELAKAPLPEAAAHLERGASWLVLGDTGPQVRQDCPGWLFLAEELTVHRHAAANAKARARTVIALQRQLVDRHIRLLVAVVPDKSRIVADQLCSLRRPTAFATRIADWTSTLAAAGAPVLDLTPTLAPLGSGAFLRTDTHWNETGTLTAAQALAARIRDLPFQATPARTFSQRSLPPAPRPGDLVRLAGLDWLPPRLQPTPEVLSLTQVDSHSPTGAADDLFGDGPAQPRRDRHLLLTQLQLPALPRAGPGRQRRALRQGRRPFRRGRTRLLRQLRLPTNSATVIGLGNPRARLTIPPPRAACARRASLTARHRLVGV